jgi:CRISP-associated protein Cas1
MHTSTFDHTTLPFGFTPCNLAEIQAKYGTSCSKYEEKATKKLARTPVMIVSGYGCALRVKNNALSVYPGRTHNAQKQQSVMLYRGVHGIKQIVLLTSKGVLSLDAIEWCKDQDIALTMIDTHGQLTQHLSPTNLSNAKLRRAQYGARENGQAFTISWELVKQKIAGQVHTLRLHPELPNATQAQYEIKQFGKEVHARSIEDIRIYEGRCANSYFASWLGLAIKWDKKTLKTIPPHWQVVTERTSPLSKNHGARWATNPAQSILNYGYAMLESQTRQALNVQGFDVSVGFLHSDKLYRDSLVYDVMEVLRPAIDHLVLTLLTTLTLAKGDMMQANNGQCIFNPQLARYIAASCKLSQAEVDAAITWFKNCLL